MLGAGLTPPLHPTAPACGGRQEKPQVALREALERYGREVPLANAAPHNGNPGFRFHDLRHEAMSRLFERGLSLPEVATISGHKTWAMLRRYTHLSAEALASKLD
jgi:integrase